ncbi:MAG: acetyl/propionyl/methylcrotonyl-CoA carboxylase subunit alpha [Alphaproteobacteria bacterium]|nr:acetyl/propionyl/methylcrotonyl-CoA carboxylase subunit alpha [Alphaproteobacteria bacterium]
MFESILIANRGEIACRVIRTARRMGLRTVAVYSEADKEAQHVALADRARLIGPPPAAESYLRIDAVIAAAKAEGAQAIHPGYGFLAENAEFAAACTKAKIAFIGPPVEAIRAMGSKSAAKEIMAKAGIALVPGYHGKDQKPATLRNAAEKIGYPVLLKASAGGGGKGMRIVEGADDFDEALKSAKREAKAGFGDDRMLVEKFIERPRHIEIQVFADSHGYVLHLFERDCSIQRRHQKVIEEAPAPGMTKATRREMGEAAVAAAAAIGYEGAGTVEFIVDQAGGFYFMEMNTRLQVEHPVTEMVTGQDLVEWQLRVAAGERLPLAQQDLTITGHAIEARIYAEDPARDFLPATGQLHHLHFPAGSEATRIDTGVHEGDEVSIYYDPMIAKLVVHGEDRAAAVNRLKAALGEVRTVGVTTNAPFLRAVAAHKSFAKGKFDTGFIERHKTELIPAVTSAPDDVLAFAALAVVLEQARSAKLRAAASEDPYSPFNRSDGWRLNDDAHTVLRFDDGGNEVAVTVHYRRDGYVLDLPGGSVAVNGELEADGSLKADIDGTRGQCAVIRHGQALHVFVDGRVQRLEIVDPLAAVSDLEAGGGRLTAPMPGKIIAVKVKSGTAVARGAPLLIMEAMKMEHTITAPADGIVMTVHFKVGEQVDEGTELIEFEAAEGA